MAARGSGKGGGQQRIGNKFSSLSATSVRCIFSFCPFFLSIHSCGFYECSQVALAFFLYSPSHSLTHSIGPRSSSCIPLSTYFIVPVDTDSHGCSRHHKKICVATGRTLQKESHRLTTDMFCFSCNSMNVLVKATTVM